MAIHIHIPTPMREHTQGQAVVEGHGGQRRDPLTPRSDSARFTFENFSRFRTRYRRGDARKVTLSIHLPASIAI